MVSSLRGFLDRILLPSFEGLPMKLVCPDQIRTKLFVSIVGLKSQCFEHALMLTAFLDLDCVALEVRSIGND